MCQIQYLKNSWNDFLLFCISLHRKWSYAALNDYYLSKKNKHPNFLPYELFFRRNIMQVMYQQNYQSQNKEIRKLKRYQERWYTSKSFFRKSIKWKEKSSLKTIFLIISFFFKETLGELDSISFLSSFTSQSLKRKISSLNKKKLYFYLQNKYQKQNQRKKRKHDFHFFHYSQCLSLSSKRKIIHQSQKSYPLSIQEMMHHIVWILEMNFWYFQDFMYNAMIFGVQSPVMMQGCSQKQQNQNI